LKPFDDLTCLGKARRMHSVARDALRAYGLEGSKLLRLAPGKGVLYRIRGPEPPHLPPSGRHESGTYLLRIQEPRPETAGCIRSEFRWLDAILKDTDLVVPAPVRTREGQDALLLTPAGVPGERVCNVTRWVEGRLLLRPGGPGPQALRKVGRLMARLHDHGHRFSRDRGESFRVWNDRTVLGEESPYFPGVERLVLGAKDRRLFARVRRKLTEVTARLGTGPDVFGLIHGDLIQLNYLFHRGDVRAVDFGDCGRGHFLYDMGITLFALWGRDPRGLQRSAFLEGYREVRRFTQDRERLLDVFVAARAVALSRWVLGGEVEEGDEAFREKYAAHVLRGLGTWSWNVPV
jgi:Ser/Thr protein kinase RdoA (MazF antagonist)